MSNTSSNLIKLVLTELGCNQQELAKELKVSPAQVSKWKSGEHMSYDMSQRLTVLANIESFDPDFVCSTGGLEQSKQWYKLICHIAESALANSETGYNTPPLQDEEDSRMELCWQTIYAIEKLGVEIPQEFPTDLIFGDEYDDEYERVYDNKISNLISEAYGALTNLYGFYAAYIADVADAACDDELWETAFEIEANLLSLAFVKTGEQSDFMPTFNSFRYDTKVEFTRWIESIKSYAIQHSVPLKAELLDLISRDEEDLRDQAERESFGFNSDRLHPDIYMNEILQSHRLIHQILPVILKKLGITNKDLGIDESKLTQGL
tara:strand:- start:302 stop:1264 length:963 start_codon:yes stop_codon:yes gene_type:complete